MTDITTKITVDDLLSSKREDVERAHTAIELAESFPVKGGDIVPKRGGGWFEALRYKNTPTEIGEK